MKKVKESIIDEIKTSKTKTKCSVNKHYLKE